MELIRLENIQKSYYIGNRELPVLKGINLSIEQGEFVAFMGPSGSGKTTLLHLIGALDKPTSGKIFIGDQELSKMKDENLAHLRNETIGFVFQNFHLLNYFSALENVNLPLLYKTDVTPELQKRGKTLLKHVGLGQRAEHKPNELSGGERQRVAIARALINNPSIVCADEPTGNLDSKSGGIIMDYLKEINQSGTTVILITHDPGIAEQAGRTVMIQDGMII